MPEHSHLTVRIEFPALDALVALLAERMAEQRQVDALAEQVREATTKLQQSGERLDAAVEQIQGSAHVDSGEPDPVAAAKRLEQISKGDPNAS